MRRSQTNIRATSVILHHAGESFCSWPAWHDLRFRDVVQYVVVYEYLRSHKEKVGTQTRMGATVARIIPRDL